MTKHIVLVDMDEPVELPDTQDMLDLNEAMKDLLEAFREKARTDYNGAGPGVWGAIRSLETACYYLWGAMGYIAKDEGLIP